MASGLERNQTWGCKGTVYRGTAEFAAFSKVYTEAARIRELVNHFMPMVENPIFPEHPLMCSISGRLSLPPARGDDDKWADVLVLCGAFGQEQSVLKQRSGSTEGNVLKQRNGSTEGNA